MESRVAAAEETAQSAQRQLAEREMEINQMRSALRGQHEAELRHIEQLNSVREQWRRAQKVLRIIEWEGKEVSAQWRRYCPMCRRGPADSHTSECELAILINGQREGK
jgi:uncharacterized coiled-coil protein SlyX